MKHRRTKATDIPHSVKMIVSERDNGCCIFCGSQGLPEAHVVSRAHGGLGIETNIVTVCRTCHHMMDNSPLRKEYISIAEMYLRSKYPGWKRETQIYNKWGFFNDTEGKSTGLH